MWDFKKQVSSTPASNVLKITNTWFAKQDFSAMTWFSEKVYAGMPP